MDESLHLGKTPQENNLPRQHFGLGVGLDYYKVRAFSMRLSI